MPRTSLTDLRANSPKLSPAERARLSAMSDAEIERNAESDADNPPMTEEALERAAFARRVRQTREALGLTQNLFAARYQIALSRLKDWEQGRYAPDSVAIAYIKTIGRDPKGVLDALAAE